MRSAEDPLRKAEVLTFGSNAMSSNQSEAKDTMMGEDTSSPNPNARKENSRKSKKDKPKKNKTKASKPAKNNRDGDTGTSEMTKLDDLPSLGGPPGRQPGGGFGRFGGFGVADDEQPVDDESNDGFDDFDINEDAFGDSSNKFDDAERHLKDFYKEENEGFKISSNKNKADAASKAKQAKKAGFKVNIQGMHNQEEDFDDDIIEEDIQTDRDEQANLVNPG